MSSSESARRHYWLRIAALLALGLTIYLLGNNLFPLVDRDEPRYAQASRQMFETGDWITPRYLDELRLKKPILIYWLQASAMKLFGGTDFAARFPSVIASVLTLLLFAAVWPRMVGYRRALWGVFIFATMLMPAYLAKVCMTDAVLHLFIAVPMLVLFAIWIGSVRPWMLIVMGLSIGGSLLTKGPPAILFLGTTLLTLWVLGFTVPRDAPTRSFSPQTLVPKIFLWTCIVLGLAVGVCVPWALAMERAHPGALLNMFFDEVVKRGNEAQEGHGGPPGFYFVTFWATAFPWCLFWPAALWHGWKRRRLPWVRFSLAAIVGPWVFLELYKTKLPHYWLPSFPFVALLIADVLVRAIRGRVTDLSDRPFVIAAGIVAALVSFGGGALVYFVTLGDGPKVASYLAASVLWLGILAACWGSFELIRRRQLARAAIVMGLGFWAVMTFIFSVYAPNTSAFTLAKRMGLELRAIGATENIRMIEYKEPSLAFYQGGTIREQSENTLPDPSAADSPRWIVISDDTFRAQPERLRDGYTLRFSAQGMNLADGTRKQLVHVLEKKFVPATLPSEEREPAEGR
jgi:4-amino-4-deoxy-L-arabinose transferase-like glycosyltransferase